MSRQETKCATLVILATAVLAEYGYGGYEGQGLEGHSFEGQSFQGHGLEGHSFEGYSVNEHQSLGQHHGDEYDVDYHAHPKYSFDYSVKDPHTGDDKEHWETRDGDKVKGTYTLVETDGTKRIVEYEADDKNGFNAVVHKIGTPKHMEEYKVSKPSYEPIPYQHDYHANEEGFMPSYESYEH
ncbi:Cuticle protein 19 [Papilio xuthus]|uniref:Cuticle protein 19 n=1 Tax=Papilio xuthus TaxID=66420 RepID=A0A0N0P9S3_PAPXU|nr:Cuticle protein 19 [Papilio xuthus]